MEQEKNILDKIYDVAKAKRIVLTQDEFAKIIGTSRASLHRYRNGELIPQALIKNAKELIGDTSNVSHETLQVSDQNTTYLEQRRRFKNSSTNTCML